MGRRKREKAPLVTADVYRAMVKVTGADVVARPKLSEATAVKGWAPRAKVKAPLLKEYGAAVKVRSNVAPSKNRTFVTVPLVLVAVAPMLMVSVLPKTELLGGLVMVTLGGLLPELTVIFTTLEVVERLPLSVATAVSA